MRAPIWRGDQFSVLRAPQDEVVSEKPGGVGFVCDVGSILRLDTRRFVAVLGLRIVSLESAPSRLARCLYKYWPVWSDQLTICGIL